MVILPGVPYKIDMLYMRLANPNIGVVSMPLCEAFDGVKNIKYNRERTQAVTEQKGGYTVCFNADKDSEKNKSFEIPAPELASILEATIYNKQQKILNLAVQPEGELLVDEVKQLIES